MYDEQEDDYLTIEQDILEMQEHLENLRECPECKKATIPEMLHNKDCTDKKEHPKWCGCHPYYGCPFCGQPMGR